MFLADVSYYTWLCKILFTFLIDYLFSLLATESY